MKLLAPANPGELSDRERWFKMPEARKLAQQKRVIFGIEMKGPLENIQEAPPVYWGLHLPDTLATEWYYHPARREAMTREVERVAKLKPAYAVLHGIHLLWHPPTREYIQRYANRSDAAEYLKILDENIKFIQRIKTILPIRIENFPLYNYYQKDGEFLPETYLYTGIGRLNDLFYLKQKTGVDILLDLEHLILTINFLNRRRNYHKLPKENPGKLKREEKTAKDIFGFYLKKNLIPYADEEIKMEKIIKKIGAKFYHLTGSVQDVIPGKKIITHGPIKISDKTFRKNLRSILAQKPEVLVVETASFADSNAWKHLRPNETEISFNNLCEILLEEL